MTLTSIDVRIQSCKIILYWSEEDHKPFHIKNNFQFSLLHFYHAFMIFLKFSPHFTVMSRITKRDMSVYFSVLSEGASQKKPLKHFLFKIKKMHK